jgi:Zn-dependent peptidase ImmA (M78 family)
MRDEMRVRQLAIDTRMKLGLQSTEHCDVDRALVSLGVTCIKRPLESSMSGATLKTERARLILVNTTKTLGHQHFTVAHELYHVLHDEHLASIACRVGAFEKASNSEQIADAFAVHLLMPEDAIAHQLRLRKPEGGELTVADVVHLEQFFGVSRKTMCWRLEDLGLITRDHEDKLCLNVIQSAKSLGKSTDLYKATRATELISDYAEKAAEALEKGLITEARYEELLADAGLLDKVMGGVEEADSDD